MTDQPLSEEELQIMEGSIDRTAANDDHGYGWLDDVDAFRLIAEVRRLQKENARIRAFCEAWTDPPLNMYHD